MLNSTQRSNLRKIAQNLDAIFQIGKGGLSQNQLNDLSAALEAKELIKVSVLANAEQTPKQLLSEAASLLGAEEVCAIGRKIVLYRMSSKKDYKHILF